MTNKENVDIIIEYRNLIITALLAAKEAGEVILNIYGSDFNVEFKNDRSPLTMADRFIGNISGLSTLSMEQKSLSKETENSL